MMHRLTPLRPLSVRLTLAASLLTFVSFTPAAAQELPRVRITRDATPIRAMRYNTSDVWRLTEADAGTVYEVLAVDGDQVRFIDTNYYLVLLPRDAWGTQWVGWISARNLESVPREEPAPSAALRDEAVAVPEAAEPATLARPASESADAESAAPEVATALPTAEAVAPPVPEIVLRFAFDRSELSEVAKETLTSALARGEAGSLSFSVGGHTDATGPEDYNHKLGLARAEAVRQYLVEAMQVPADRIGVSSYGETRPSASNDTREGRAENRRVVVTVTAAPQVASAE